MHIYSRLFLAFMTLCALGPAVTAAAQPCHDDVQKFCADVKGGAHAVAKCLTEHAADLSEACKAHRKEMRHAAQEKTEKISPACKNDAQTFCKGVPSDRLWACLKSNKAALSDACNAAIDKEPAKQN